MSFHRLNRRMFLAELSHKTMAVAILGGMGGALAACGDDDDDAAEGPGDTVTSTSRPAATDSALRWERVSLDFVSAYVLARGNEAAVVDTGTEGSAPAILDGLSALGLGWDAVGHVVLTHRHPDHVGSVAAVLDAASSATAYAGEADIGSIESPGPLQAVADGADLFGLQVIATPGHTPGHIAVLDPEAGILVAGDALVGADGGVAGPNPEFTADMDTAIESVEKLAGFSYHTVLFGHGEPVESNAAQAVADLAATL